MQPYLPGRRWRGGWPAGGIVGYPLDSLYEEVAFIAYHFHWRLDDILNLEHADRQRFVEHISAINRQMNQATEPSPSTGIPIELWG